jgi:Flp pilus assembly protein TadG
MRCLPRLGFSREKDESGQALVEFTLVLVLFLLLVSGLADFGLMFGRQLTINDAARAGARWAAIHPTAWSNAATPPSNTIEGQVQAASAMGTVSNDDTHIVITYLAPTGSTAVVCGKYSATSSGFVAQNSYTQATCLVPGTLVQVQINVTYPFATPLLAQQFGAGIPITSTATMLEES